ncbi:solute carrier family 41 [Nesidiocoris tenuis]|uniref:Solute carrier family 41 n=1 Tax=Nesidiocoris tenuis TaxID=355587 RepID=A0ABN7AG24_9HEMI|nr:solute carrier family 41 [Nesidiocoris tenuis]
MENDTGPSPSDSIIKITPPSHSSEGEKDESFWSILYEVALPLLLSGLAMVGAGIYLHSLQDWPVFKEVDEIIILVPALLGLKGNLEMTLGSRLSTEANLGHFADLRSQYSFIFGNLALVQCQAIVIGLLSALVTIGFVLISHQTASLPNSILLIACSMTTASIASFILGCITVGIVIISARMKINPDNVTTPIAASLGDITSLVLLSYVALCFHQAIANGYLWMTVCAIGTFLLITPLWIYIAMGNPSTYAVLRDGWVPIISAMVISTIGGLALERFMSEFEDLSAFQPVINGIGGNLVSIQASKLSTSLHKLYPLGSLPDHIPVFIGPLRAFASKEHHSLTSRALLSLVIPGHLIFAGVIVWLREGAISTSPTFYFFYLLAASFQVGILLYAAYILTHFFWKMGTNPDNSTIPYLTAMGDLLGIILLGLVYQVVEGNKNPENVV